MNIEFKTIPVGLEGEHVVQKLENGEAAYLASVKDDTKIGRFPMGVAAAEILRLRYGQPDTVRAARWLPWRETSLDSRKPMSMFPPARRSPYDTLGRAS